MAETDVIPENAVIVAADAGRAQFLLNAGKGLRLDIRLEKTVDAPPNPRTGEQGADRPGRTPYRGRSSAMEETDWARLGEAEFAATVADLLHKRVARGKVGGVVLIAAPGFLGDLRKKLSAQVKALVVREIAKDYAQAGPDDIARILSPEP